MDKDHRERLLIFCHLVKCVSSLLCTMYTVVKELRSKMFGQHPGYFKAVFLKQTRIIIVSIYKYTVYIMFELWCFMIVIIINFIFCPNIIYFCSVILDFSINYKESGIKITTINWNVAISCIYEWIKRCQKRKKYWWMIDFT